jgi:hypothetical protein
MPPRRLTPEDRDAIEREVREYVGGVEVPRERDSLDRLAIAHEVRAYSASVPPPQALVVVQERVNTRPRTDTDRFDIEELQRQLREATERAAADKIAEARARALAAEAKLEERAGKTEDRWWQIAIGVLLALAAAVAGHFIK